MEAKRCHITWRDATSADEWIEYEDIGTLVPHVISTLGWLIKKSKDAYIVALSIDREREAFSNVIIIPKPFVLKMEYLDE